MVRRDELLRYLHGLLNVDAFSDYCPNGLQVEGRAEIRKLVCGVTACQALVDAAVAAGADALLVHHGYFWKGEQPTITGLKRRRVQALLEAGINLLAYHLPLDAHPQLGNNAQLAQRLGLTASDGLVGEPAIVLAGSVDEPVSGEDFAARIADRLQRVPLHIPGQATEIRRIAWCSGGAQGHIGQAAALGVDAYLTGEVSEQTVHIARETGLHFFAAGHHATERYGAQALGAHLAERFALQVEFVDIDNPA
ncbi:MAG TPA: Nif3-like dinuclear metal center hexameric protein [Gammaproteobacteria bacterium]|nr:Nif3-like dinuclear metal center hexameric protein [Gammaproteobacteria bacterium]